ncbi:uncharacterized protein LOC128271157 [Anopheles cruzii]|uniref:uncharacterized protein LOC128271157 n=1 Tax=Anopheles cruzii TaxID=68878 RepID=UPI0022EC6D6D|nr:uncharacterized protein LOC128271157 [Anopheles cruzii]
MTTNAYRMRDSNGNLYTGQLETRSSESNGAPSDEPSEYFLALSYTGYDFFRSVVEIALTISFLAANSNLLRLLVSFKETETFIASEALVTISILLQILVGIAIVTITQVNDPSRCVKMKAFAVTGAILIALINLMIPFIINVEHSRIDLGSIYRSYAGAGL